MGYITHTISSPGTNTLTRTTFPITEGILFSVAITGGSRLYPYLINWAEIGIMNEGSDANAVAAALCNGHLGAVGSLGWTGRHPISTGDLLYIDTWGQWQEGPRFTYYIVKPDPNKSSMEVLDA